MPERDTMPLSPQEIAKALVPEKVAYQFSPDFETLYVTVEVRERGRLPAVQISAASLPELFRWLAHLVNEAAQQRLGGQSPSPQDGDVVATLPHARVYVRAAVEAPGAGAIVLDMGVCRLAVLCEIDELCGLGADASRLAAAIRDMHGTGTA